MKNFFTVFRFFISLNLTQKSIVELQQHFNLLAQVFLIFISSTSFAFLSKLKNYEQWQQNFNLNSRLLFDYVWFRSFFFVLFLP